MKRTILFVSVVLASGVLFTNIYNSTIDARSWGSDLPRSIETARSYFAAVNPGHFHRIATPLVQVLSVLSLILCWRSRDLRLCLAGAVACFVVTDVMTYGYFYPRNAFMFERASLADVEGLTRAWSQWSDVNWIRSGLFAVGVALSCVALHRSYARGFVRQEATAAVVPSTAWLASSSS